MPCLRFTKVIINHFLSIHKFVPKALPSGLHTIMDDGVLSRMKFVRIGEDVQEYGRAIPDAMLTDAIKQSETYKAFISYSIGLVPLKKTRGKGSKGKKSTITPKPTSVEVSDEFEPEPARRQTGGRRMSKKKVSIFIDDNIIPELDVSLELGKSIELNRGYKRGSKQLVAATMQALKANSKSNRSQPHTIGSSEGTGVSLGVLDESTVIISTSSEGTEEESKYFEEETVDEEIQWLTTDEEEEKKDDDEDERSIDIEKIIDDEETDNEFVHGDEYVHDNVDEEMNDAKDDETEKDDEEITDVEKTEVSKGDLEQARKPPLTSSSLYVSSGFGNQFLNLSFDTSLIGTLKEPVVTEINSL
ncbi:hypothetical protein Tco_1146907 [Tanacetum coccineum]